MKTNECSLFKVIPPRVACDTCGRQNDMEKVGIRGMRKSRGGREGDHSFNVLSGQDRVLTDP